MGYYINEDSKGKFLGNKKVDALIADGAKLADTKFQPNLICVVSNGPFDAAGYCFSEDEFKVFNYEKDTRPKTWLVHPMAAQLSGYTTRER